MNDQLRPMTLGEILDRTAELYRSRFSLFAGISTLFAAAMLAIQLVYVSTLSAMGYPHIKGRVGWLTGGATIVEVLAILILAGFSIVAVNRAVAWVYLDQEATVRAAVQSVKPRAGRYLWLMTQTALRAWGPLALLYAIVLVVLIAALPHGFFANPTVAAQPANQNLPALISAGIATLILIPIVLVAVIYGVIMTLRYSLGIPACVVEELPATLALKRSVELSKGSRGRIFVLGLLIGIIRAVITAVFGIPIIAISFGHPGQSLPLVWLMVQQLGVFFSNAFVGPIYAIGLTLFYYDQRIRREAFDLEWMMQAAGMTEAPASLPESAPQV